MLSNWKRESVKIQIFLALCYITILKVRWYCSTLSKHYILFYSSFSLITPSLTHFPLFLPFLYNERSFTMIINLWVSTNGAPQIWLWVVMGLLIGFGHGFGVEFRWWIVVGMGVVVWWWPSMAWALISVEDRDGSLTRIGVAWHRGSSGYLFCL